MSDEHSVDDNHSITIYTTRICPYCVKAKKILEMRGLSYHEMIVESEMQRDEMISRSGGRRTVPQIFIGDIHVGGCEELQRLDESGELSKIIKNL